MQLSLQLGLIRALQQHDVPARAEGDELVVLDRYTRNGVPGERWVRIPATVTAIRDFLGY